MNEQEIRKLAGQVIVAGFQGTEVTSHARTLIEQHHVANIILFAHNVVSMDQVAALNADLQALAEANGQDLPLMICTDQENGIVRRIAPNLPGLPGNMAVGATFAPEVAYEIGAATARQLLAAGINWNLAPVLDVNNNAHNPVIGVRSYGEDAESVAVFGTQMALGLQDNSVIACGKHFPGHGDTDVDSHLALPKISHDRERLESLELVPFQRAIEAGLDSIMTAHVVFPAYEPDNIPATLSKNVLTGLLREQLGFRGVITTDCMEMKAISDTIGTPNGAVQALSAGADIVMVSHTLEVQVASIERIVEAVKSGELPLERLVEAAGRVRALKAQRLGTTVKSAVPLPEILDEAQALQEKVSAQAVTVVKNESGLLPVRVEDVKRIAVLLDSASPYNQAAGNVGSNNTLSLEVARKFPDAELEVFQFGLTEGFTWDSNGAAEVATFDLVIAGVNGTRNTAYIDFVAGLAETKAPIVVIALQSPYDLAALATVPTALCVYESTPWMIRAGVESLLTNGGSGRLPVSISDAFVRGHGVQHVAR